jgi:hypothetical protein
VQALTPRVVNVRPGDARSSIVSGGFFFRILLTTTMHYASCLRNDPVPSACRRTGSEQENDLIARSLTTDDERDY